VPRDQTVARLADYFASILRHAPPAITYGQPPTTCAPSQWSGPPSADGLLRQLHRRRSVPGKRRSQRIRPRLESEGKSIALLPCSCTRRLSASRTQSRGQPNRCNRNRLGIPRQPNQVEMCPIRLSVNPSDHAESRSVSPLHCAGRRGWRTASHRRRNTRWSSGHGTL
jgi:hypothetical protein